MTGGAITDSGWKKWTCGGGLNSSGTLAGCYNDGTNEWGFTFSRSSSSTIPFSSGYTLEVTGDNYVAGISNAGVIVTHSQLLYNGGELPFNDPAFYVTTDGVWHSLPIFTPESIAGNFVVGSSAAEDPFAVNNTYGQICTLGTTTATNLVLSGDAWSLATGVSTNGIAVGVSDSAGVISSVQEGTIDTTQRAFVYNGSATVSLNSLAVVANPFANLQAATSISNNGEYIVGYGPVNGVLHGFLLTAALPGDANLDGRVDVNDLTIVLSHFGQSGMGWSQGEFTGDGMVDVNDLTIVLSQFGQGLSSALRRHRRGARAGRPGDLGRRAGRVAGLCLAAQSGGAQDLVDRAGGRERAGEHGQLFDGHSTGREIGVLPQAGAQLVDARPAAADPADRQVRLEPPVLLAVAQFRQFGLDPLVQGRHFLRPSPAPSQTVRGRAGWGMPRAPRQLEFKTGDLGRPAGDGPANVGKLALVDVA